MYSSKSFCATWQGYYVRDLLKLHIKNELSVFLWYAIILQQHSSKWNNTAIQWHLDFSVLVEQFDMLLKLT